MADPTTWNLADYIYKAGQAVEASAAWIANGPAVDDADQVRRNMLAADCDRTMAALRALRDKVQADKEAHEHATDTACFFSAGRATIDVVLVAVATAGDAERALLTFIRTGQ